MSKPKHPNINATVYDGELQVSCDCVGRERCQHARTYVEPPEPDDECIYLQHCNCQSLEAKLAAMKALIKAIEKEVATLMETTEDGQ